MFGAGGSDFLLKAGCVEELLRCGFFLFSSEQQGGRQKNLYGELLFSAAGLPSSIDGGEAAPMKFTNSLVPAKPCHSSLTWFTTKRYEPQSHFESGMVKGTMLVLSTLISILV